MPTVAAPKTLKQRISDARRHARRFRAAGEEQLADRWDDRVNELLEELLETL